MKKFFGTIWKCIYPILIYLGIMVVVQMAADIIFLVPAISGSGTFDFEQYIRDSMSSAMAITGIVSAIAIPVCIIIMKRDDRRYGPEPKKFRIGFCILITVLMLAATIGGNILINLSGIADIDPMFQEVSEVIDGSSLWVQLLVAVILGPVTEELLFRGIVFRRMSKSWNLIVSILLSSLMFALFHGNLVQGLYAMIIGVILTIAYYNTGSIVFSIVLHVFSNLAALLVFS